VCMEEMGVTLLSGRSAWARWLPEELYMEFAVCMGFVREDPYVEFEREECL